MSVRVLIVEDDRVTAQSLKQRLERMGCDVVGIAADATDALAQFRDQKPDLVTLDISLTDFDGSDAVKLYETIRAEDPNCEIAVISASAFPRHREIFRRLVGFYSKPINFEEVARGLRKYFPELKPYKPDRAL
jgi:two-component system, chemotaxis family, chemotaxis protein CheY